jgi:O-antigen polysaccharide polymerase Wzy
MRPRSPRTAAFFLHIYAVMTGAFAVLAALMASPAASDPIIHFRWTAAAAILTVGSLIAIARVWSATGVYAAVFGCFHFGLIVLLASGYIAPAELPPWVENWVLSSFAADAAALALAASLAFASGAALVYSQRVQVWMSNPRDARVTTAHSHGVAGSVLVFGALATWCGIVLSVGGATAFFSAYDDYLQMTSEFGTTLAVVWPVLGCGIVMAVTGRPGWHRTAAVIAFGCFAIVALPLGLRSEVMFPTVVVLIALARCGKAVTPVKAAGFGLALLLIIPLVRDVRSTGLGALADAELAAPGLDALAEMGASLHPVEKVVRWHAEGEAFEKGATYWAPFERAASRLLPGLRSRAAAEDDLRIMNVLVLDRVGAIGFSPVAEAYRNFGPIGVVIVLGLLGMVMAAIDTIRDPGTAVLVIAIAYVPLLINVRNSFVSVPAQCVAGLVIVIVVAIAHHIVGSVLDKPDRAYARPAYIRSEIRAHR